jgi:hypothetical protein
MDSSSNSGLELSSELHRVRRCRLGIEASIRINISTVTMNGLPYNISLYVLFTYHDVSGIMRQRFVKTGQYRCVDHLHCIMSASKNGLGVLSLSLDFHSTFLPSSSPY